MKFSITFFLYLIVQLLQAQSPSTLSSDSLTAQKVMSYELSDRWLYYPKPKPVRFITNIPRTFRDVAVESFSSKKSLEAWGAIAASTTVLLMFDQLMLEGVQNFSGYIGLERERVFTDVIKFNLGSQEVNVYQAPGNFNSFVYQIGEGLPSLMISGGLALYGVIKKDYRARSTANQMVQTFIVMGVSTQLLKRVFGRESPFMATVDGGRWRPFPNWGDYQKSVPRYDAFPSGHMATMMATVTVISDNYPEKRWIKPVGYCLMGLVGLSMMNNGVHWAGDYPLAIGLGYVVGKVTVKMNRWVKGK